MPDDRDPSIEDLGTADGGPAAEWVRVRIALGGVTLAFEGRRAFFDEHVASLLDAAYQRAGADGADQAGTDQAGTDQGDAMPGTAKPPGGASFQPSAPQQFQKFAGQVGANAVTIEQRVMVFAFYLWNYERKDEFSLEDIASFFRTVNEEPPEDLDTLLDALCTGKRFLEARRGTAAMCLTTKGVNYVKNRLLVGASSAL